MEHLPVALNAVKLAAPHYETAKEKAQQRIRGKREDDPDLVDSRVMEDKGYVLRRRRDVRPDEKIVEVVRHKGEVLPRRPRPRRQTSSMEDLRRGGSGSYQRASGGYGSDSEGSVPPSSRARRPKSTGGRSRRARSSSSSSVSSSQLGSSTEEEKEMKKLSRKKWVTAGLATIATIHASSKVYNSIEKHDKRVIAVQQGTMSPEEAHKQARSARWQDAAAIGIAALGIKGALSEWKEMAEEHEKHKELCEQHELQHRKRIEHMRRKRAKEFGGYYKGRDGNWYYDGTEGQASEWQRQRARSSSTWDTYDQLAGPQQNERKMIEAPPSRSRSVYGRDRSRSRAYHDRDDESHSSVRAPSRKQHNINPATNSLALAAWTAPFLGYGAYKLTKAELANEPVILKNEREAYLSKRDNDRHEEYKDLVTDTIEEVLEKVT